MNYETKLVLQYIEEDEDLRDSIDRLVAYLNERDGALAACGSRTNSALSWQKSHSIPQNRHAACPH